MENMNKFKNFCQGFIASLILIIFAVVFVFAAGFCLANYPALSIIILIFSTCLMNGLFAMNLNLGA